MAKVVQITAENFETEVAQASETRAVAVLFSSAEYPDCAPYSQLLGSLSTSMDFTLGVVSCDERENMQLIQAFRVRSVPEVHIVEKGQIADVIQGVLPEADLKKRLEKFFVSDEARFQAALEDAIAQCGSFDGSYRHEQKYFEFKEKTTESILQNIAQTYPSLRGHLKVLDSASPLTSQRFSPPIGSAYGTRQTIGVSRLSGRLPVTNCHALGHHAHFPGTLGCMLGAYLACM